MTVPQAQKAHPITGSMLYDLVACPHRVTMDLFADPAERDAVSPFVQLLWDRGSLHEKGVIEGLREPFIDLSRYAGPEKEKLTLEAMDRGEPLIYGGRISSDDLLGEPDLLRKEDTGYVAGDIKSGAGEEGASEEGEGKPKKHYAVQLALYTDILERIGRSAGHRAFIWDVHGEEVIYDFVEDSNRAATGRLWDQYLECLTVAQGIVNQRVQTLPAYASGTCKNCVWYTACLTKLESADDLTLIPGLGRSKRDVLTRKICSIKALAEIDPADYIHKKKTDFRGIGPESLLLFASRARLLTREGGKPYLRAAVDLPPQETELFFDIEVDPMRDLCYLHGFLEREGGEGGHERFVPFFASDTTPEAEEAAFAGAWDYMRSSQLCGIYYYSKYERSIYKKLRQKYPRVCSEDELKALFDPKVAVDLYYDVVLKATEWPTRDFSIKTLAKYLGFSWRDTHPSGAASIEWFDRWVQTQDPRDRQRILDYNEDDCRATRVLLDAIRKLPAGEQ